MWSLLVSRLLESLLYHSSRQRSPGTARVTSATIPGQVAFTDTHNSNAYDLTLPEIIEEDIPLADVSEP